MRTEHISTEHISTKHRDLDSLYTWISLRSSWASPYYYDHEYQRAMYTSVNCTHGSRGWEMFLQVHHANGSPPRHYGLLLGCYNAGIKQFQVHVVLVTICIHVHVHCSEPTIPFLIASVELWVFVQHAITTYVNRMYTIGPLLTNHKGQMATNNALQKEDLACVVGCSKSAIVVLREKRTCVWNWTTTGYKAAK